MLASSYTISMVDLVTISCRLILKLWFSSCLPLCHGEFSSRCLRKLSIGLMVLVQYRYLSMLCLSQFQLGTSPRQPLGISSKTLPGGSGFDFWKLPRSREFDKGGDLMEIQSETFCLFIGFIGDKYRVSQKLLNNGEHYIVDFQFKLR